MIRSWATVAAVATRRTARRGRPAPWWRSPPGRPTARRRRTSTSRPGGWSRASASRTTSCGPCRRDAGLPRQPVGQRPDAPAVPRPVASASAASSTSWACSTLSCPHTSRNRSSMSSSGSRRRRSEPERHRPWRHRTPVRTTLSNVCSSCPTEPRTRTWRRPSSAPRPEGSALASSAGLDLDLDVDAGRAVDALQASTSWRWFDDVDQPLVDAHLEVLARVLVREGSG